MLTSGYPGSQDPSGFPVGLSCPPFLACRHPVWLPSLVASLPQPGLPGSRETQPAITRSARRRLRLHACQHCLVHAVRHPESCRLAHPETPPRSRAGLARLPVTKACSWLFLAVWRRVAQRGRFPRDGGAITRHLSNSARRREPGPEHHVNHLTSGLRARVRNPSTFLSSSRARKESLNILDLLTESGQDPSQGAWNRHFLQLAQPAVLRAIRNNLSGTNLRILVQRYSCCLNCISERPLYSKGRRRK